MSAPTREEFIATLNRFRDLESDGDVILNNAIVEVDLIKAFDALAAERDAAVAALRAQGEIRLDIRGASDLRLRVGVLLQLHWKTLTNAQLDAIQAICDRGEGAPCDGRHRHPKRSCPQGCWDRYNAGESTYPEKDATDPRIEAWRALDAEARFAARRGLFVAGHNEAAAALEALEEKS